MQTLITNTGPLLTPGGSLVHAGWSPQPLLDCNLEAARFYSLRFLQRFRIKRWDYYAVFTPRRFFSATIADIGYIGNLFVYTLDFATKELHEESLIVPLARGVILPRNSTGGTSFYEGKGATLEFHADPGCRRISVDWPSFHNGRGIQAEISLSFPANHESMNITTPIGKKRFYFNRKANCLPAIGSIRYGEVREELRPGESVGSLDWGRGIWDYSSFWNWASASGFLPDGRTFGLNLGEGFGDLSAATENCLVLNGRIHKLDRAPFVYDPKDYMKPWIFNDNESRLRLMFSPFVERTAKTNLGPLSSEVHQMFGRYNGQAIMDDGETVEIRQLIGFAEEHRARW
jgi:hypothetical protein